MTNSNPQPPRKLTKQFIPLTKRKRLNRARRASPDRDAQTRAYRYSKRKLKEQEHD